MQVAGNRAVEAFPGAFPVGAFPEGAFPEGALPASSQVANWLVPVLSSTLEGLGKTDTFNHRMQI